MSLEIGNNIKSRRKELKISADDIAKRLGVSRSTVFRWESGEIGKIPSEYLKPLAEMLSTTETRLMGWQSAAAAKESYIEEDIRRIIERAKTSAGMKNLLRAADSCTDEELERAIKIIKALKEK